MGLGVFRRSAIVGLTVSNPGLESQGAVVGLDEVADAANLALGAGTYLFGRGARLAHETAENVLPDVVDYVLVRGDREVDGESTSAAVNGVFPGWLDS